MANTYIQIATVTVGSGGAASMDFTSIPSTYTDLCLKISSRGSRSAVWDYIRVTFNGNTSSIYSYRYLEGAGSGSATSGNNGAAAPPQIVGVTSGDTATTSTFGNAEIYIPNYANTSYSKSLSIDSAGETNATTIYMDLAASLFASTAAISSISLAAGSGFNFVQYSTATLYGISKS
jgi:hypothetical protein